MVCRIAKPLILSLAYGAWSPTVRQTLRFREKEDRVAPSCYRVSDCETVDIVAGLWRLVANCQTQSLDFRNGGAVETWVGRLTWFLIGTFEGYSVDL